MAYKEAIARSNSLLLSELAQTQDLSRGQYIKEALFVAGVFNTQAKHLEESSKALVDQALDTLIDVRAKLKKYGKKN